MKEPRLVCGLKEFGDAWATDLHALVIAFIVTLMTAFVLNLLGLLR